MKYSVAQESHQGGRNYNEDSLAIFQRDEYTLLIVADGLGGHAGGELASQTLIEAISESFRKATRKQLNNSESFLSLSINYAHHMIHRRAVSKGFPVDSPKTTCVVCLIHDGVARWAHSGDSRFYILNNEKVVFVSEDHVSKRHPEDSNSPINRCVGGLELPRPEISEPRELESGDILVLASDGAWHNFTPKDLTEYVNPEHPTLGLDNLLQKLEERNRVPSDNLSMVLLYWGIKQLDMPNINEFLDEESFVRTNHAESEEDDEEARLAREQFDIENLDNTINEIESFIADIGEKI